MDEKYIQTFCYFNRFDYSDLTTVKLILLCCLCHHVIFDCVSDRTGRLDN